MASHEPRPAALPFAALITAGIWLGMLGLCVVTLVLGFSGRTRAQGSGPASAVTLTFRPPAGTAATARQDATLATFLPGTAVITELSNSVEARKSTAESLAPAQPGQVLLAGSEVQVGPASAARLDFEDGAVARLGSNTIVSIEAIASRAGSQTTRFGLQEGQVWANLRNWPLAASTVLGVGTAYGPFAEFIYEPGQASTARDDVLTINCFKGPCSFESLGVTEFVGDLTRLTISGADRVAAETPLTAADVRAFILNNPEGASLTALVLGGAAPTGAPEPTESLADTAPPLPTSPAEAATSPAYPGQEGRLEEPSPTVPATPSPTATTATPTGTTGIETPSPTAQTGTPTVTGTPPTSTPETGTPVTGTPGTPTASPTVPTPTATLSCLFAPYPPNCP